MNAFKDRWQQASAWFDALVMRERVLVLAAVVIGTALVYDAVILQPLQAQRKQLDQQLTQSRQNIKAAEAVLKAQEAVVDPGAVKRAYREALRKQLAEIDRGMQGLQRGLVAPERMGKLLEDVLGRNHGLRIVSMRTLPARRFESLPAAPAGSPGDKSAVPARPAERAIYQHSFELTLQGSYAELHEYLAQLEKLDSRMFWGRIIVNTERYPRLRATVVVQTLSLNKAWLIV